MAWKPDYVTSDDLKAFVRISDSDDDTQIALAVTGASRAVDRHCKRQFGQTDSTEERFYTAEWDRLRRRWVIQIDDLMTETGLAIDFDVDDDETYSGSIDEYRLRPANAAANGRPWTEIVVHPDSTTKPTAREGAVRVTAQFGWTAVPDTVKQATLLQGSRILSRRDSPYGVAGSPDLGSEMRLLAKVDPDVAVILDEFVRHWAVV